MQITVVGGLIFGVVCILVSILLDGDITGFVDVKSIFIVVGGVIAATLVSYPMKKVKRIPKLFGMAMKKPAGSVDQYIDRIIELAELARKEGLLALGDAVTDADDPFMRKGVMLMLDGSDPELVKGVLETEVNNMAERHCGGIAMFNTMSAYAPAFGMVGTLIGLINMLAELDQMDTLGASMAVALVTTFYGCVMANLVFTPIARQLADRSEEEQLCKSVIIEGILSIQDGENPRVIKEKLLAFVSYSEALREPQAPKLRAAEKG